MRAGDDEDGSVPFDIEVVEVDGVPVVRVRGEVDVSTSQRFLAGLQQATGPSPRVVVDLSGITFMDAAGLGVLAKAARDGRRQLVVRSPNRLVRTLLSVTDVEQVLTVESGEG